jgi:hypothetical protein
MTRDDFSFYKTFPNLQTVFELPIIWIQTKIWIAHDSIRKNKTEAQIITNEKLCNDMNATIKYTIPKLI